jgi:hypothetical protein
MKAGRLLAVVIPLAFVASVALAQASTEAGRRAASPREGPGAPAGKGLVVFIDPVTGKIRQPEAAEIGGLVPPPAAVAPPVESPLVMKIGPGGAVGVVLDSRFESYMVVTKTPDGKLAMDCVAGRKKADEAVSAGAKNAGKPDGKEASRVR